MKLSDLNNVTRYTGVDRRAPRTEPSVVKPGPAIPRQGNKASGRHSAITTNLHDWRSYKNWVEKVRGCWEDKK